MEALREPEVESEDWSADRTSDVGPINLAVRLCALAWDLFEDGELDAARDAALDATVVWAVAPSCLDEEVLIEMLQEVCGAESEAIMSSIRMSPSLAAWREVLPSPGVAND